MKRIIGIICIIAAAVPVLFGCGAVKYGVIEPARVCAAEIKDEISDISDQILSDIADGFKDEIIFINEDVNEAFSDIKIEDNYDGYYLDSNELSMLHNLMPTGYRNLTVEKYINAIDLYLDNLRYEELAEQYLTGTQILNDLKSGDAFANYIYYILGPLVSGEYDEKGFGDCLTAVSKSGDLKFCLEYEAFIDINSLNLVTVGEYERAIESVKEEMRSAFNGIVTFGNRSEYIENADLYEEIIKNKVREITEKLSNDRLEVSIEYITYIEGAEDIFFYDNDFEPETRYYRDTNINEYKSFLSLMTDDYKRLTVAEFNEKLLDWTNEDPNRA